jgi:hypothetical protein
MKTPREILLARHKAVEPKLDAIRRESVAQASSLSQNRALDPLNQSSRTTFRTTGEPFPLSQRERAGVRENHSKEGETAAFRFLQLLWHNLFLPSRRIWTGLAAVWIIILAANFSLRDNQPMTMAKSTAPEIVPSLQQQEQLLTKLTGSDESAAADPQKSYTPRPSSQRPFEMMTA